MVRVVGADAVGQEGIMAAAGKRTVGRVAQPGIGLAVQELPATAAVGGCLGGSIRIGFRGNGSQLDAFASIGDTISRGVEANFGLADSGETVTDPLLELRADNRLRHRVVGERRRRRQGDRAIAEAAVGRP